MTRHDENTPEADIPEADDPEGAALLALAYLLPDGLDWKRDMYGHRRAIRITSTAEPDGDEALIIYRSGAYWSTPGDQGPALALAVHADIAADAIGRMLAPSPAAPSA